MICINNDDRYVRYGTPAIVVTFLYFSYAALVCSELPNKQIPPYSDASKDHHFDTTSSNNTPNPNLIDRHAENGPSWSIATNKKKKKKVLVSTQAETPSEVIENQYPEGTDGYAVFAAYQALQKDRKIDHIIERHYDPRGKYNAVILQKNRYADPSQFLNKPYEGVIDNKYTTFFPQKFTEEMIRDRIKDTLVHPYRIVPSKKFNNALEVRGKFEDGVTTEVIISKQTGKWEVKTAYPKFRNTHALRAHDAK